MNGLSKLLVLTSVIVSGRFAIAQPAAPELGPNAIVIGVNRSAIVDVEKDIKRIAVGSPEIADATAVSSREVLVTAKAAGETSLIVWDVDGNRFFYDIEVAASSAKFDLVQHELETEFPGQGLTLSAQDGNVFLRGVVPDLAAADRAAAIAGALGKVVNLLQLPLPPAPQQVLLRVRFADVDRSVSSQLGVNLFSVGKTAATISTETFSPPQLSVDPSQTAVTFGDGLNLAVFNRDLNLGATIKALEARNILQILAEPNLMTMSGKPASFLAGGEFPFPTIQGGANGIGQITVQFHEFGVRLQFLPVITPRGTIHLQVQPEVSSLDFANGLTVDGFTVPGLDTRRVSTEIELADGQSFVIAGLLDQRVSDSLSKVPGLGDIPLLGKLFQSRSRTKNNSELMVLVTPEIVQPIPAGSKTPDVKMPVPFLTGGADAAPRTPGIAVTGNSMPGSKPQMVPVEKLREPAPVLTPSGH